MERPSVKIWPHYDQAKIESVEELRQSLGEGADKLNWLFLSTSGVHGSCATLDDIGGTWDQDPEVDGYGHTVTVLLVRPRLVSVRYGNIPIEREDIPWLREQVARTLRAVATSQKGNLKPPGPASPS